MKYKFLQYGMSLTEVVVIVAVIALLIGLSVPAYRAFDNAINAPTGVESMVSAALSSARALAAKHQTYAGIRFQRDINGNQYMIPIIYDDKVGNGIQGNLGMRAVKGINPVKLPEMVSIFDLKTSGGADVTTGLIGSYDDISKFSVLFAASGNLVIHNHWVKRINTNDTVFNIQSVVDNGNAVFVEDSGWEKSRSSFVIYEKKKYDEAANKWDDYVKDLPVLYINPYTGAIIQNK